MLAHQRELRCLWESRADVQELRGWRKDTFEESVGEAEAKGADVSVLM